MPKGERNEEAEKHYRDVEAVFLFVKKHFLLRSRLRNKSSSVETH